MRLLSVARESQLIFISISNFSNKNRRLREVTRFFNPPSQSCCLSHTGELQACNHRTVQFSCKMVISQNTVLAKPWRIASVSDFNFPSTCSGRRLKFGFSAAILAVISSQTLFFLQFTFLKSFSCSLYWEINSKVSSLLNQKPFLLSTASTLSPEQNAIFVSSGSNDVIILALPAILLLGAE